MNSLLTLSGTRLARMIREGEVSSVEVVERHIAHIRKVNPTLNALVGERFDLAREEARAADRQVRSSPGQDLPPFLGVPCTIKESFALTGMPQTGGLVSRRNRLANRDATAVSRLRAAGAIPLGVTNVSELCMWMESSNRVYGRSNNPYDPKRIVGGSSGGEGAIVGAGGSPFGLGADIGGSIRMPAFFCGVFGHKPTGGLVPNTGQFPIAANEALRYLATGPLCRRAEDLMPLLRLLAGPDGEDTGCRTFPLGDPATVRIPELSVLDVPDNGIIPVSRDLRAVQRQVASALSQRGARVERKRIDGLKYSLPIWMAMLSAAGGPSFKELMADGRKLRPALELVKWAVRRGEHTLPAIGIALLEGIPKRLERPGRALVHLGLRLREEVIEAIGDHGVMLFPSYPTPAPRHHRPLLPPIYWVYTGIFNMLELPSTQVPLGLNRRGLPLGVQVIGSPGSDHLTIAVAIQLEKIFGGWVPPPFPTDG